MMTSKMVVGNLELCSLPQIGVHDIEVRVDTGAKTSSLHVDNVKKFTRKGKPWIKFDIHPDAYNVEEIIACEAPLHDVRNIKSSNGVSEERYVIKTDMKLGEQSWLIEITLTNRSDMKYLMLLGRQGMGEHLLVDPSQTFMLHARENH